ncbi:class A sortase, partial [Enterococcus hirae]|nr:class A sortase [Enterococcus hirae]
MKKWLFGFLGVDLIVFCSVFGYVSYQKHEGEVFKQNIEKKMHVDQINAHAKSYKEDATNVNNDMSLGQMLSIQKEAIEMGVNKQV